MTRKPFFFTLIWSLIIILLCSLPSGLFRSNQIPQGIPHTDKLVHLFLFAIWMLISLCEHNKSVLKNKVWVKNVLIIISIGIIFGLFIEGLQWLLNWGRSAELMDVVADLIGLIAGTVGYFIFKRSKMLTNTGKCE